MGEAILTKAGGSGGGCIFGDLETFNNIIKSQLATSIVLKSVLFDSNGTFTAPKSGYYNVSMCGGGGSGGGHHGTSGGYWSNNYYRAGGGGSGFANIGSIYLNEGENVSITIGSGAACVNGENNGKTGGTTSFGTYLSALGGNGGQGVGQGNRNTSYRWAGGNGYNPGEAGCANNIGGNGGTGFFPVFGGNQYGAGGNGAWGTYTSKSGNGYSGFIYISWY